MISAPAQALSAAREAGFVDDLDTSVVLVDLTVLGSQLERVRAAFPPASVHAIAVKTNPLACVLSELAKEGAYAEAASFEELLLATRCGFGQRTVWDSPAKTAAEVAALNGQRPWLVNLDSLAELDRIDWGDFRLGLRINPEREIATVAQLATGVPGSKFGEPISNRSEIVSAFQACERLVGIHVHGGSNVTEVEPLVEGIECAVDLAREINRAGQSSGATSQVDTIDIGGGLPHSFEASDPLSVERYGALLRRRVPELFDGTFRLVTEFGRFYHHAATTIATQVIGVRTSSGVRNIVVGVGADAFLRQVYSDQHGILTVTSLHHRPEPAEGENTRIVGPLCFEGDVIEADSRVGSVEVGDWLLIKNVGANTIGLWSKHCSRPFPKVLTYRSDRDDPELRVGKRRQTAMEAISHWE